VAAENQLIDDERPTVAVGSREETVTRHRLIHVTPEASVRQANQPYVSTYNVSPARSSTAMTAWAPSPSRRVMARAIGQPKILDSAVRDVMDPPFPVVDGESPVALLTTLLSRTTPLPWSARRQSRRHRHPVRSACTSWRNR